MTPLQRADQLIRLLEAEPDPVSQVKILEIMVARIAMRMGDPMLSAFVADSIAKHAKQLMEEANAHPRP